MRKPQKPLPKVVASVNLQFHSRSGAFLLSQETGKGELRIKKNKKIQVIQIKHLLPSLAICLFNSPTGGKEILQLD